MAKEVTSYYCSECGHFSQKWIGKCPLCNTWDSFVQETISKNQNNHEIKADKPVLLSEITDTEIQKISTNMVEFDRILGGGIVPGSVILLGGDPGIGKSTIALQLADILDKQNLKTIYISGEESKPQLKLRAERLHISGKNIQVLSETVIEQIENIVSQTPLDFVIIDSIQTTFLSEIAAAPGTITQIRESAFRLINIAKRLNIPILIIGHVTKDGNIAGPKILEHMVDTVLYFEGDKKNNFRILRSFKNRFGATNEIGLFEMTSQGLAQILNPSQVLIEKSYNSPGNTITCIQEGTRPLLVEIQALVLNNSFGIPRRTVNGIEQNRLAIILAAIEKRTALKFSSQDVFINVIGGLKINDPGVDLAIAAACISSYKNKAIPPNTIIIGEVGLGGETRDIPQLEAKLKEAAQIGITTAFIPETKQKLISKIEIQKIKNLIDLLGQL